MEILVSKLQPPKRENLLHRKRLTQLFKHIDSIRLVSVTAGAGYGKTTLVLDSVAANQLDSAWYRLDEQDNDFLVFINYLYTTINRHFSHNDRTKEPNPGLNISMKNQTETLLEWLRFVEKKVTDPLVLILDDYHLIQENKQINQAVEFILERLPDHVHLVIVGRKNLDLKLSVFRARDQLIEINEEVLSFTHDETKLFFDSAPGLTDEQVGNIHSNTQGWAAGIVLLRYATRKKT